MQQALDVLKIFIGGGNSDWARKIEALRDRLAQPEEPTHSEAWWKHEVSNAWAEGYEKGRSQREWKGLADEDREAIALLVEKMGMEGYGTLAIAAAIRKGEM